MRSEHGRPRRLRAQLTSAGWIYLGLAPILGASAVIDPRAAVLTGIWAAFGTAHCLLARVNFLGLRLRLERVEERTREDRGVSLVLEFSRRWNPVPARSLRVQMHHPRRYHGQVVPVLGPITRNGFHRVPLTVVPPRFGRLFIHAAEVSSTYPFGLYRLRAEWLPPPTTTVIVWPRRSRIPAKTTGWHEDDSQGAIASAQPSVEIRPYAAGDPLTLICWKSTARTGRMLVRPRETTSLRARELVVSTQRTLWAPGQFWTMLVFACALLEEGYRRGTIGGLQLDREHFPLRNGDDFTRAMDALCCARPTRSAPPEAKPRVRALLVLRPFGKRAVRALTEKGAVLSHVA